MRKLEDTLKGGYKGLYGEVVTCDIYRLKTLPFVPNLVVDIGANVGVFTRFARQLWPQAILVAVEPDRSNWEDFLCFTLIDPRLYLIEAALGSGPVYRAKGAVNGAHECYLSPTLGYRAEELAGDARMEPVQVNTLTLEDIVEAFAVEGRRLLKVDCEGAENSLWESPTEMAALQSFDYICMELHWYACNGQGKAEVNQKTEAAFERLRSTHAVTLDRNHLWALKK